MGVLFIRVNLSYFDSDELVSLMQLRQQQIPMRSMQANIHSMPVTWLLSSPSRYLVVLEQTLGNACFSNFIGP